MTAASRPTKAVVDLSRYSYLLIGSVVVVFLLVLRLQVRHTISLDIAINDPRWRFPYALRLPAAWLLIVSVLLHWVVTEKNRIGLGKFIRLPHVALPAALLPPSELVACSRAISRVVPRVVASRALFVALIVLTLVTYRWRGLPGFENNVDESQSIVAARTLLVDPRFWISVDMGTHGPLVSLWQLLLPAVGLTIDYAGSRLIGLAMTIGVVLSINRVLRRIAPEYLARLLLLPSVYLMASLGNPDFLAYNGEYPIIFLAAMSAGFAAAALLPLLEDIPPEKNRLFAFHESPWQLFFSGVFLGGVPWAKQQGSPIAVVLILAIGGACLVVPDRATVPSRFRLFVSFHTFVRRLSLIVAGLIVPTVLVLTWTAVDHALPQMFRSYFEWNLVYAGRNHSTGMLSVIERMDRYFIGALPDATVLWRTIPLVPWYPLAVALAILAHNRRIPAGTGKFVASALTCAVCWICVVLPGNPVTHYMNLLFPSFAAMNAIAWAVALRSGEDIGQPEGTRVAWAGFIRLGLGLLFAVSMVWSPFMEWTGKAFIDSAEVNFKIAPPQPELSGDDAEMLSRIELAAMPGERMAMWGWRPAWYVRANLLSATRSATSLREALYDDPMQPYFFGLYMSDMDKRNPPIFVDVVNEKDLLFTTYEHIAEHTPKLPRRTYQDFNFERYPELALCIRKKYRLLYMTASGLRLFVRNDRYADAAANLAKMPKLNKK